MRWGARFSYPVIGTSGNRGAETYSHASWDPAFDRLHANELPWRAETNRSVAGLNRYPEPHPHM